MDHSFSNTFHWISFNQSILDIVVLSVIQTLHSLLAGISTPFNIATLTYTIVKITQFDFTQQTGTLIALTLYLLINIVQTIIAFSCQPTNSQNALSSPLLPTKFNPNNNNSNDSHIHYNAKPVLQASCGKKTCRSIGLCFVFVLAIAVSPIIIVCGVLKTLIGCCCKTKKARQLQEKKTNDFKALQIEHPTHLFPVGAIGNNAPILKGVRVLELATVVAGPSAGRILAEHGAEVIRVEPPSGDMWRKYLKILEGHRKTFTSTFEHTSFNKSSIVLDLNLPKDLLEMKNLMNKADIFITNVRLPALEKLGLDYVAVKNESPHLIYGHLSAWGLIGPAKGDPGYDFGAFWSQTGMAALSNSQGHFAQYPGAFGDTIAGSNLVSGMVSGLRQRFTNGGIGCYLETSLLRTGMWIMGPHLSRCTSTNTSTSPQANYNNSNNNNNSSSSSSSSIETKSNTFTASTASSTTTGNAPNITKYRQHADRSHCTGTFIQDLLEMNDVFVSFDQKRFVLGNVNVNFDTQLQCVTQKKYALLTKEIQNVSFSTYVSTHTYMDISHMLNKHAILHRLAPVLKGAESIDKPLYTQISKSIIRTDLTPDNKLWVRSPFDFSCSDQHNIIHRRAPELGEHTISIVDNQQGFLERNPSDPSIVPRQNTAEIQQKNIEQKNAPYVPPMANVLMIEIPYIGAAVSAATALCADDGATVYQLLMQGTHPMEQIDPHFVHQLTRNKNIVSVENYSTSVISSIEQLMAQHSNKYVVIVHNMSTCSSSDAVEFSKPNGVLSKFHAAHPGIIVVDVSSCGVHPSAGTTASPMEGTPSTVATTTSSDLGSFFTDGFLSHVLGDGPNLHIAPMFQFGEMITSIHVKTSIDLALFHLIRTDVMNQKSEGNLVEINLTRCGVYSNLMFVGMSQVNPDMGVAIDKMSFDAYVTKDGQWIQLLGVDYKKHVPRVFKALGIGYGPTIKTFLSTLTSLSSPMELIPVIFHEITANIRSKMNDMTYMEVKQCFDTNDVWYTTVASPEQAIQNVQARMTGAFRWKRNGNGDGKNGGLKDDATLLVNSPCQMTVWKRGGFEYGNPDSTEMYY